MVATTRKPGHTPTRAPARRRPHTRSIVAAAGVLAGLSACSAPQPVVVIHVADLETASPIAYRPLGTFVVSADADLGPGATKLDERLWLIAAPAADPPPALRVLLPENARAAHGTLIGVGLRLGQALDGRSPLRIAAVRELEGAGLLTVDVAPTTYLPDGTMYVDLVLVDHAATVLVVDVDDVRFYPERPTAQDARPTGLISPR